VLRRLEEEAAAWREQPLRRVVVRNRLIEPVRRRQFGAFGTGAILDRPQWLYGAHKIAIGARAVLLAGGWYSVEKQAWDKPGPALVFGKGVGARVACTFSAAESVVIEDFVGLGAYVSVLDSRHTWDPGHPSPLRGPIETAPVRIGKGTWLGDRATITAGADIGEQCAIGANSVVSGTIADYSIVLGNPGRVVGSTRT
jgi:acetyltransferase-like isoleucine patch superfamily enzyme